MTKGRIVPGEIGPQCRRCGMWTAVYEHKVTPPADRPYYSRWYRCENRRCPTTLIMSEEFKVYPEPAVCAAVDAAEETAPIHHDVALEVLADMSVNRTRPPWE